MKGYLLFPLLFKITLEVRERGRRDNQASRWKKKTKLLVTNYTILYTENPKNSHIKTIRGWCSGSKIPNTKAGLVEWLKR
jgi:hypothetical protein